ncbi:MAG: ATP-binding protein [Acidobacteriota bacterium]
MSRVEIRIGHQSFASYKRLSYEWWYALAEFVDNSSQSYFDHRDALDEAFEREQDRFKVEITRGKDFIRIHDNAMGMNLEELRLAMVVGDPVVRPKGRCRYGLGMKTAACWIGDRWRITTTKLGSDEELSVDIEVDKIVQGELSWPTQSRRVSPDQHYTTLEIGKHHRAFAGSTVHKTKRYLASIFRRDLEHGDMALSYNDEPISWPSYTDDHFLSRIDGTPIREDFIFEILTNPPKVVEGWIGTLKTGGYSKAGFSILHNQRVITDSWRPSKIFSKGTTSFVNQRLIAEINLEDFEVSHTKDAMAWEGDEEELVIDELVKLSKPYKQAAYPTKGAPPSGPAEVHVAGSIEAVKSEMSSPEFTQTLSLEDAIPPSHDIEATNASVAQTAASNEPRFTVSLGDRLAIKVYMDRNGSPNDPYFIAQEKGRDELLVIINELHPHWSMLEGPNAVANHLRHCIYDSVAEFRAAELERVDPMTIKMLKDKYLRVAFEIAEHSD